MPDNQEEENKIGQQVNVYDTLRFYSGGSKVQYKYDRVEFTSALILACYDTPLTLVAAPGAGRFLEFVSLTLAYDYGATAYTIGSMGSWRVRYHGVSTNRSHSVSPTGFIDQSSDQVRYTVPSDEDYTPSVNTGLDLVCTAANPTAGDGVIHAHICYRIWETGL